MLSTYKSKSLNKSCHIESNWGVLLIPGIIGAGIALGAYFLTHDDYSFGQGLEYAEAGFIGSSIAAGGVAAGGVPGGLVGSVTGAVVGQILINDAENRPLDENLDQAAIIGLSTFGIGETFLPAINSRNLQYPLSYLATSTGRKILGRESLLEIFGWSLSTQNLGTISNINRYLYQAYFQQYQEMKRQEIIAQAKTGSYSGDAGYNENAGAYVTENGQVYPTTNPDWKPCGCSIN